MKKYRNWQSGAWFFLALFFALQAARAGTVSVQVIDKNGKPVADAVVVLMPSNMAIKPKTALPTKATVLQERMQFLPMVTLVATGAKVTFINNDPWDHHVRGYAADPTRSEVGKTDGFEMRLEGKSDGKKPSSKEIAMDKQGVLGATLLGCFIHGSMRGYIYASESPWASKTNGEGIATFEDVPEGVAQVRVWQADQFVDLPPKPINVISGLTKEIMQLQVAARRPRV
jgi:plastocyanin